MYNDEFLKLMPIEIVTLMQLLNWKVKEILLILMQENNDYAASKL
jgi:hypothetical protein